jgi:hypothetical protein
MQKIFTILFTVLLGLFSLNTLAQAPTEPLGLNFEGYDYPYPLNYFDLKIEDKPVRMAY